MQNTRSCKVSELTCRGASKDRGNHGGRQCQRLLRSELLGVRVYVRVYVIVGWLSSLLTPTRQRRSL